MESIIYYFLIWIFLCKHVQTVIIVIYACKYFGSFEILHILDNFLYKIFKNEKKNDNIFGFIGFM